MSLASMPPAPSTLSYMPGAFIGMGTLT